MTTQEKIERAIELLNSVYDEFDELNGYLHDIVEETPIDTVEYDRLATIWLTFPTWSTLDELKELLENLNNYKESDV